MSGGCFDVLLDEAKCMQCLQKYMYTELSETDSSVLALPLWSQTTTVLKRVCMLAGSRRLVWTLSTASDETFPKEAQAGEKCFPL